jgi:hypothetical protein
MPDHGLVIDPEITDLDEIVRLLAKNLRAGGGSL